MMRHTKLNNKEADVKNCKTGSTMCLPGLVRNRVYCFRLDIDLLNDLACIFDFDTKVANLALDFGANEQELDCGQMCRLFL